MRGGKSKFHKRVYIDYLYTLLSMCIKTVRVTIERTNTEHINFKTEEKNQTQMPVNPKKVREEMRVNVRRVK